MIVNQLFSVPVVFFEIPEDVIQKTLKVAYKYIEESKWKERVPCGETFTTYYNDKNFLGNNQCTELLELMNSNIREFLKLIGKNPAANLKIENWLNYNPIGTGHEMHEHFSSIASGVVYLDANTNSGNLVFHDPITTRVQANSFTSRSILEKNNYNHISYGLNPQNNRMIIFEGWLYHSVEYNKTDKNRISISFNTEDVDG